MVTLKLSITQCNSDNNYQHELQLTTLVSYLTIWIKVMSYLN